MFDYKRWSILFIFIAPIVALTLYSELSDFSDKNDYFNELIKRKNSKESYFTKVNYYLFNGRPELSLISTEMTIDQISGKFVFEYPKGQMFLKDNSAVDFYANKGVFRASNRTLNLEGSSFITAKDGSTEVWSDDLEYLGDTGTVKASGHVKTRSIDPIKGDEILIWSNNFSGVIKSKQGEFVGNVKGTINRKKSYEDQVSFEADQILLDLKTMIIKLEQNVLISKQFLEARGHKGNVYLDNYNKKLKYYEIYDDVRLTEVVTEGSSTWERKAFGEKLEGHVLEGRIVLTGYPKVYQKKDIIKGNKITLRDNSEIIEVDDSQTQFMLSNEKIKE